MTIAMDPHNACCPECGAPFSDKTLVGSAHMDKYKGTIYAHQCACGVRMGIFIADQPKPGETYTLRKMRR